MELIYWPKKLPLGVCQRAAYNALRTKAPNRGKLKKWSRIKQIASLK